MRGENWRFWAPVVCLAGLAVYSGQKLVRAHVDPEVNAPDYSFSRQILARMRMNVKRLNRKKKELSHTYLFRYNFYNVQDVKV